MDDLDSLPTRPLSNNHSAVALALQNTVWQFYLRNLRLPFLFQPLFAKVSSRLILERHQLLHILLQAVKIYSMIII